jgi:tetratricopeptide (TPR) repeat protein
LAFALASASAFASAGKVEHAYRLIEEWRIEEADAEIAALVKAHPHDSDVAFLDGDLKFQHQDYEAAAERLEEAVKGARGGELGDEIRMLRDLARATADATKGFLTTTRPGAHFVIAHASGKDALLAPYALDALEKAWRALGTDFGDSPAQPIRVEIYPEVADLAKVSTLTLKEIETSGTIALCKFNRLMIVSPRALIAGYPWLDTLTHEYTHFIVSRTSHNTVPIWLHEGLAKFEERRWRKEDRSGGLTPTMEHLLATGLQRKHLITFEQMHPSMAKLPSQEDTALAFAEVYTVVEYLVAQIGWDGVRKVIAEMKGGKTDAESVATVLGRPFAVFQHDWRGWLASRKLRAHPGLVPTALRFKKAPDAKKTDDEDLAATIGDEKVRKFARLGGMLRARRRLKAAASEYEKALELAGPGDPRVSSQLARTYLELGDHDRAIKTAEPLLALYPDQAGPNATVGESWLHKGDAAKAEPYLLAAIAISPFDPALHCGLERVYKQRGDARSKEEATACARLSSE